MKTGQITTAIILLFFIINLPTSADGSDEISSDWKIAVKIYDKYSDLKPYNMQIHSETYNGKGELEKTEEQIFRLSYNSEGDTEQNLIKALEDGRDITEKKRKELEKDSDKNRGGPPGDMEGMDKHPLDPRYQDDVTAVDTGQTEYLKGSLCSVWEFSIKLNDKYTGIGKAWLKHETGEAVSIEYRIDPLFPFVQEMNIGMDFNTDRYDRWILENLRMNGRINMIIMKKSFKAVTSFSDYR